MSLSKNQRRQGNVVTLRVNPKDAMSVVDVLQKAGVSTQNMSFAMMVSLALTSVMQTLRDAQVIPEREGFEYLNVVGPHVNKQSGKKLAVTDTIKSIGSKLRVSGLSPVHAAPYQEEYKEPELTAEQRRIWSRLGELQAKMDLAEQEGSGIVFSAGDMQEFNHLNTLV